MATTRIKDLSKTATTVASDANIVIDGSSNGTQKITRDNFRQDTADAYVAAPSTYKLAPLNGVNKIDGTYLPTSGDTPKGEWNASTNSPTLADGTGTAGDYYDVTTAGTANLGSGAITYTVGDVVKYNGATWFKIDSVANILDGISTVDPAKVALQIPNVGTAANEVPVNGMLGDMSFQSSAGVVVDDLTVDGHFTGTVGKPMPVNGPTMRFDGSNDYVEVAHDAKLSFTDGSDDLPFSVSTWIKMTDATNFNILNKATGASEYIFSFQSADKLRFLLSDNTSGNLAKLETNTALTAYEGQWIHVAATYAGTSGGVFSSAASGLNLYINGKQLSDVTATTEAGYLGMKVTAATLRIGNWSTGYTKGEIRDVKLFNKALSAAEVREVYSNGQLPESFAESTGSADGGIYTSDFSAGVDGTTAVNGVLAGNVDSVGPSGDLRDDNLRFTANAGSSYKKIQKDNITTVGKRNRATFDYFIPSGQSNIDGFAVSDGGVFISSAATRTLGTWTRFEVEYVGSYNDLHIWPTDGTATTYDDTGGDDVMYVRNVKVTQIGSVLDARAENYNQSAGKLLDVSGNDFVGTQSGGVTLLTPRSHLSAGTLDLTNLPTSASGLSAGEVYNDSGILKIV
jgi:hypothetical protein